MYRKYSVANMIMATAFTIVFFIMMAFVADKANKSGKREIKHVCSCKHCPHRK